MDDKDKEAFEKLWDENVYRFELEDADEYDFIKKIALFFFLKGSSNE